MHNSGSPNTCFIILLTLLGSLTTGAFGQRIPEDARQHWSRGLVVAAKAKSIEEYAPAIREFQEAVRLAPEWADSWYNLGCIQESAAQHVEALQSLRRCLELAPNAPGVPQLQQLINTISSRLFGDKVNPKDGAAMMLIPAGEFLMGTSEGELAAWLQAHPGDKVGYNFTDEIPQHKVDLDAYYLYKTEVTVAQFRKFCIATGRPMPPEPFWKWQDTHPIVNVSWEDANAYAQWAGVSLPTEVQWEKAARGGDGRIFPWGNAWPPPANAGNCGDETCKNIGSMYSSKFIAGYTDGYAFTSPVGSFPANPYGVHDLEGNVAEWCADWYNAEYYRNFSSRNPTGPATGTERVLRGGCFYHSDPSFFRSTFRRYLSPTHRSVNLGFRCVMRST